MRHLRFLMLWHGLAHVCPSHGIFVTGFFTTQWHAAGAGLWMSGCCHVCGAEAALAAGYMPG